MSDLVVLHLYSTEPFFFFFFLASAVAVLSGINTITHTQAYLQYDWEKKGLLFVLEQSALVMRLKCGQAEGQVNETTTESLAVFDLPPLIQRDHLIN